MFTTTMNFDEFSSSQWSTEFHHAWRSNIEEVAVWLGFTVDRLLNGYRWRFSASDWLQRLQWDLICCDMFIAYLSAYRTVDRFTSQYAQRLRRSLSFLSGTIQILLLVLHLFLLWRDDSHKRRTHINCIDWRLPCPMCRKRNNSPCVASKVSYSHVCGECIIGQLISIHFYMTSKNPYISRLLFFGVLPQASRVVIAILHVILESIIFVNDGVLLCRF